jgi:oligosaccharide repeat unit polymerase
MKDLLLSIEFAFLLSFCGIALYFLRDGPSGHRIWRLKPSVLFIFGFGIYSSAMPLSRLLGLSAPGENDLEFMLAHLLAAAGILMGSYFSNYRFARPVEFRIQAGLKAKVTLAVLTVALGMVLVGRTLYFVGFKPANLLERYRFEQTLSESEGTTGDKIILFVVSAVCTFGLVFWQKRKDRTYRAITFATLAIVAIVLLIRGNRNPFMLLMFPALGVVMQNRPLKLKWGFVLFLAIYASFQSIAIVRNVGLINRSDIDLQMDYYDPLRSELGTSYNVWTAARTTPFFHERCWGATIFADSIVNLVPATFWPDRPLTAAAKLSVYYYESAGEEVFGLGYSPVLEAYLNFGIYGLFPWFTLLMLALVRLERFLERGGIFGICAWAALLPIVINMQRIDAAVVLKLYSTFLLFFLLLYFFFCAFPRSRTGLRAVRTSGTALLAVSRSKL